MDIIKNVESNLLSVYIILLLNICEKQLTSDKVSIANYLLPIWCGIFIIIDSK